jgi:hypothetical protein
MQWPKGQTMIYKALHRKLKIEQHKPHLKPWVNSCGPCHVYLVTTPPIISGQRSNVKVD